VAGDETRRITASTRATSSAGEKGLPLYELFGPIQL
jgi:hypothetical protein